MSEIIFGGTFDPLHLGHLILAGYALWQTKADRVIFVPSGRYPSKENNSNPFHRLTMLQLALKNEQWATVCPYELEQIQQGTTYTYTYNTVQYLKQQKLVGSKPYLLIGDDQLPFERWHKAEELSNQVTLLLANRYHKGSLPYPYQQLDNPLIQLSSTFIKDQIKNNAPFKWYLSPIVYNYIQENNLYR